MIIATLLVALAVTDCDPPVETKDKDVNPVKTMQDCAEVARKCCDSFEDCTTVLDRTVRQLGECSEMVCLYKDLLQNSIDRGDRCVSDLMKRDGGLP